jgi:hypothetical protein
MISWRKEWDSNPRGSGPPAGFQDRCLKPLGHPSNSRKSMACIPSSQERLGNSRAVGPNLDPMPVRARSRPLLHDLGSPIIGVREQMAIDASVIEGEPCPNRRDMVITSSPDAINCETWVCRTEWKVAARPRPSITSDHSYKNVEAAANIAAGAEKRREISFRPAFRRWAESLVLAGPARLAS